MLASAASANPYSALLDNHELSSNNNDDLEFMFDEVNTHNSAPKNNSNTDSYSTTINSSRPFTFRGHYVHPVSNRTLLRTVHSARRAKVSPPTSSTTIAEFAKAEFTKNERSVFHFIQDKDEACADSGATDFMLPD